MSYSKSYSSRRYKKSQSEQEPIATDGSVVVSSLRPCRDDPARVHLCVDRRRLGRILLDTKFELKIEVGTPWTQELADQLEEELGRGNAYLSGARILAKRAKSARELERKLKEYGHSSKAISWAIERLIELQVLNDEQYAQMVVRNQLARKPAGRRFLVGKLREKGIENRLIEQVLDEALEERDGYEDALKLARTASRTLSRHHEQEVIDRRITGRLARRGFDFDVIRKVLAQVHDEHEE